MNTEESGDIEFRTEDEYIAGLRAELENSFREFDKLILTVSSGILALSVAFFGKSECEHASKVATPARRKQQHVIVS